jgi:integrator complex subunit 6
MKLDRYKLEQSPLTQRLMGRKDVSWPLYVKNSHKTPGLGHPFGVVRWTQSINAVEVFVLPYDFPRLFRLIGLLLIYLI